MFGIYIYTYYLHSIYIFKYIYIYIFCIYIFISPCYTKRKSQIIKSDGPNVTTPKKPTQVPRCHWWLLSTQCGTRRGPLGVDARCPSRIPRPDPWIPYHTMELIFVYIFTYILMVDFYGKCRECREIYQENMDAMGMLLRQFVSSTYHVKYLVRD